MRDIANKAGCHYSTVSLALRNHPRIAAETRERVQRAAAELGYRPDPMLAALNAYRVMKQPPRQSGVLAWLTNYPTRDFWRDVSCECIYHQGAQRRAEARGYRLEHLAVDLLADMIHRNEKGVLVLPQQLLIDGSWHEGSTLRPRADVHARAS